MDPLLLLLIVNVTILGINMAVDVVTKGAIVVVVGLAPPVLALIVNFVDAMVTLFFVPQVSVTQATTTPAQSRPDNISDVATNSSTPQVSLAEAMSPDATQLYLLNYLPLVVKMKIGMETQVLHTMSLPTLNICTQIHLTMVVHRLKWEMAKELPFPLLDLHNLPHQFIHILILC